MPIQEHRGYHCTDEHRWEVPGVFHWNPWGPPDFEASSRNDLQCPHCGKAGQPVPDPPTGTSEAVSLMIQNMERRPREDHNRTLLYYQERTPEGNE